ncbi:MAG TPA: GAF domain-containing SpoIIE family protein phosphatase [Gemmatimonadales bacterium]
MWRSARGRLVRVLPPAGVRDPDAERPLETTAGAGAAAFTPLPRLQDYWFSVEPNGSGGPTPPLTELGGLLGQLLDGERDALRLAAELKVRLEEIELLYTISETLGGAIGLEAAAATIVREISKVVGAGRASILVYDDEARVLRPVAGWGRDVRSFRPVPVDDPRSIAARVFREQRALHHDPDDPATAGVVSTRPQDYKGAAYLVVPIVYPQPDGPPRPIGVVNLTDRLGADVFSESDRRLVAMTASQIGAALENARLAERDGARQRLERELELARTLQQKLLPDPAAPGVDVAARCVSVATVGGDFYHVLTLRDGAIGVMLGDVSSHGFGAAMMMALVLSAAGIHAASAAGPEEVLRRLRTSVAAELAQTEMFLTLFYGVVEPGNRRLRFANAGHPHAFRLSADGAWERLSATTPPLGLAPEAPIRSHDVTWGAGDLVLLFSDGIPDTRGPHERPVGEQRVLDQVREARQRPAREIVDQVLAMAAESSATASDDRTILVLKA